MEDRMVSLKWNPTGRYEAHGRDQEAHIKALEAACGLIPFFWMQTVLTKGPTDAAGVMEGMLEEYGFGTDFRFPGSVTDDGVYEADNDEDEPLYPYVRADLHIGENVVRTYIYPYGITAVCDANGSEIVRMD